LRVGNSNLGFVSKLVGTICEKNIFNIEEINWEAFGDLRWNDPCIVISRGPEALATATRQPSTEQQRAAMPGAIMIVG